MRLLLLPAALLATGATDRTTGAPIEVTVSGVRAATGKVIVAVCPEQQFLKQCSFVASAAARGAIVTVTIANVPPGRYAAQAFADADDNGRLDTTMIGLPREGFGFSNNAMRHFLPPRFASAAFDHGLAPQRLTIALRYFAG